MDLYQALYTTRAMRRVHPDPVPEESVRLILDAAVRSPSGGNRQPYRFVTVTERDTKDKLGQLYREGWDLLRGVDPGRTGDRPPVIDKNDRSTQWQVDHFADVPLWILAFGPDPCSFYSPLVAAASVLPAVWSVMLAARGQGLGTSLTTMLGMFSNTDVCGLLGVPIEEGWVNYAAISVGYPTGVWRVAKRSPAHDLTYAEYWNRRVSWSAPEPALDRIRGL